MVQKAFAFLCAGVCLGITAPASATVMTLQPYAAARNAIVRLGELVLIGGGSPAWREAVSRIEVGQLRPDLQDLKITPAVLQAHIAKNGLAGAQPLTWEGAKQVHVKWAGGVVEGDALATHATDHLGSSMSGTWRRLELRPLGTIRSLLVPPGAVTLEAKPQHWAPGQRRVRVDVRVDVTGRPAAMIPVWFEVRAFTEGWVSRADLPKGHVATEADFELAEIDAAQPGSANALARPASGTRLTRSVRAGEQVSAQLGAPRPWVGRQEKVVLELKVAAVVVESAALALADGREGDVIPVRLASGGGVRQGRVIAPGRVGL